MNTEYETIDRAIEFIELGFCKNASARSVNDKSPVNFTSELAVEFCVTGAINRAALELFCPDDWWVVNDNYKVALGAASNTIRSLQRFLQIKFGYKDTLVQWNDAPLTNQFKVLELLREYRKFIDDREDIYHEDVMLEKELVGV